MSSFRSNHSFDKRLQESNRIFSKYPERIPIICEIDKKSCLKQLIKTKYLVPNDLSVSEFITVIRKKVNISSEAALFLFVETKNNSFMLPAMGCTMDIIYNDYKFDDGFLYMLVSSENTFG